MKRRSFFDKYGVGLIVVGVGIWFLLKQLDIIDISFGNLISFIVAAVIIMYGISMIGNSRKHENNHTNEQGWTKYNPENYDYKQNVPPPPPPLHDDPIHGAFDETNYEKKESNSYESNEAQYKGQYEDDYSKYEKLKNKYDHYESKVYNKLKNKYEKYEGKYKNHTYSQYDPFDNDKINKSSFIGDFHFGKDYWELKPMNLSHFIGDTVVDLSRAQIPVGETRINISAFIGDIKIFVPNDTSLGIKLNMSSFIGESKFLEDKEGGIFTSINQQSTQYYECERQIIINVSTFIGDVKVKKVG